MKVLSKVIDLLPDVTHKQKMFINMLIAQVGFLSLTSVMVWFEGDLKVAIIINLLFAVIIAFLGWASFNRVQQGIKCFNARMTALIDYAFMKTNRMPNYRYKYKDEIGWVLDEFDHFTKEFDKMRQEDMRVIGEVVLSLSKVEKGSFKCGVKATSTNFMIRELSRVINRMIKNTKENMDNLNNVLNQYTNNDFRQEIHIDDKLADDLRAVMESVNKLGIALKENAKRDLLNGQTLESNAITMTSSVNSLAHKANEQAASLEETAAALEEITSITRNNADNAQKMAILGHTVKGSVSNGQNLATQTATSMEDVRV